MRSNFFRSSYLPLVSAARRSASTWSLAGNSIIQRAFTDEHVATFHRDGVVCVPEFVSATHCDYLRAEAAKLVEAEHARRKKEGDTSAFSFGKEHIGDRYFLESGDKIRFFLEPGQKEVTVNTINKIAHALHTDGGAFQQFASLPQIGAIARKLGRMQPSVVQSMYIVKPPHVGTEVGPHQDDTWIYTRPFSCLGIWFALEDCTVNNSCLLAVKGSQHWPLTAKAALNADGSQSVITGELPKVDVSTMTPIECPKGSVVVFGGGLVHASTDNKSDRSRHAVVFHVVDDMCAWAENNWFGTHLARLKI